MVGSRTRLLTGAILALAAVLTVPAAGHPPRAGDALPDVRATARAVEFVGATTSASVRGRVVLRRPPNAAPGDVLLAALTVRTGSPRTVTAPAGWQRVRSLSRPDGLLVQVVYLHVVAPGDGGVQTWRVGSSHGAIGAMLAYRGVDTVDPVVSHAGRTRRFARLLTLPSVVLPEAGGRLVALLGASGAGRTSPPAQMRERFDVARGGRWALSVAGDDAVGLTAGASGAKSVSFGSRRATVFGQVLALRPRRGPRASDTTPPSPPTDLEVVSKTGERISLSWTRVNEPDVAGYEVYQDGAKLADVSTTSYTVAGLACGTSYSFAVNAVDRAGNRSARTFVTAATEACPDSNPPSTPGGLAATSTGPTSIGLAWTAATDDVGVSGYSVYVGAAEVAVVLGTTYVVGGLLCATSYTLGVEASDAAGNTSARATLTASTGACSPLDSSPPTTPTGLVSTGATETSVSLDWDPASDNVAVTSYGVYRNGAKVADALATEFTVTGLPCGTSSTFSVDAADAAGNRSGKASVTAATRACPPPPSGCPTLMTPTPVPGYCTGRVISITPGTFGSGVFGSGGISVSPGDVVVFAAGTYTDTNGDGAVLRIRGSGTAAKWITFVSQTKWGAHLWGNNNAAAEGISLDGADYVRVEGFEVSDVGNVGSPRGSASGIDLYNGGKNSHIVGNHVHHVGRVCADPDNTNGQVGIYVQTGANGGNIVVENNLVHDIGRFFVGENGCGNTKVSLDHGMYLNGSTGGGGGAGNITIRNNIFHDTHHGWGVQFYPGSLDNVRVVNNTFAFCNESKRYTCIVLDAAITNSVIKNNVFHNPAGGKTIEAAGFSGAITIGNNVTSGTAMHDQSSTPSGMTLVANRVGTDALLVNPLLYDFHLLPASPAISAGETLSYVVVDHEGRPRPQGSGFDAGAYEYGG